MNNSSALVIALLAMILVVLLIHTIHDIDTIHHQDREIVMEE